MLRYTEIGGFFMLVTPSTLQARFEAYLQTRAVPTNCMGNIKNGCVITWIFVESTDFLLPGMRAFPGLSANCRRRSKQMNSGGKPLGP
jgi:hypothetical protein